MDSQTSQHRSSATIKNMGVHSYSQIISAFRAQGDLTEEKLAILPVLQNALGINRERHTAEVKRALYDEHLSDVANSLNPSSTTVNWELLADSNCPTLVHRPPKTESVIFAENILQATPPTAIIQYPLTNGSSALNHDLKQVVKDLAKYDGIRNATQPQPFNYLQRQTSNYLNTTDIHGFNGVRPVRAKQPHKPKSSLDTLIEVVQKDLLHVPESTVSTFMHSHARISSSPKQTPMRTLQAVFPSSHPASLTQSSSSLKITRKNIQFPSTHLKRLSSYHQRQKSFNHDDDKDKVDHDKLERPSWSSILDEKKFESETIEDIVRETVDRLVAITIGSPIPTAGNMQTSSLGNGSSTEFKPTLHIGSADSHSTVKFQPTIIKTEPIRSEHQLFSSKLIDSRTSTQQTSPMKSQAQQQPQIYHPQLILQPTNTSNPSITTPTSLSTISGSTTSTLFVAPRIINFQTVVPKPTTNIQIGNTKIILVSPSNITQHLPHTSGTSSASVQPPSSISIHQQQQQQQQSASNLVNNSPVKLVKYTTNNSPAPLQTRSNSLPMNSGTTSTLALPKNVQIVIPTSTSSTLQLARTRNEDLTKSLLTTPATNFRPISTVPMTLTTCAVDQIPQAAQEVTIGTSPRVSPTLINASADLSQSSSSSLASTTGKISPSPMFSQQQQQQPNPNLTSIRTSPLQEDMVKSMAVTFPPAQSSHIPRPASAHGPMIYRMTSVNPNVPVFRVRTATAPSTAAVMNKSIKTEAKPIAVTTTTSMCYEPKPTHPAPTPSGSVSVLACFKTTKKRNKERAIMPRPSTTESMDSSHDGQQHRLNSNSSMISTNASVNPTSDFVNSNSSTEYRHSLSLTPPLPPRLVPQTSLSSTLSEDTIINPLSSVSFQEQLNDTTISSSESIPILRRSSTQFDDYTASFPAITSPSSRTTSPPASPIPSFNSMSLPKPDMEDKSIQCVNEEQQSEILVVSMPVDESPMNNSVSNKRKEHPHEAEQWTETANDLIRDLSSHDQFRALNIQCQQDLVGKFELLQASLISGIILTIDEFYQSVLEIKKRLLDDNPSTISEEQLEKLFQDFDVELEYLRERFDETKRLKQISTNE